MTLLDLCRLVKRNIVLVVALTVVCGVAGFAYASIPDEVMEGNSATSRIVVNSQVTAVAGLTSTEARQEMAKFSDEEAADWDFKITPDGNLMTVTIVITGNDEAECLRIANDVAQRATAQAREFYADNAKSENLTNFVAQVEPAQLDDPEESAGKSKAKYALVGLLAGLFLAICIVVIIDIIRRPVKSVEGVQDAVELPVLEILPTADGGDRLLANIRFASKVDDLRGVCIIPAGDAADAQAAAKTLADAVSREGLPCRVVADTLPASGEVSDATAGTGAAGIARGELVIAACKPLSSGMEAAYESRKADAVVVAVAQWRDSMTALETTVAELKLAESKLAGLVFVKS